MLTFASTISCALGRGDVTFIPPNWPTWLSRERDVVPPSKHLSDPDILPTADINLLDVILPPVRGEQGILYIG